VTFRRHPENIACRRAAAPQTASLDAGLLRHSQPARGSLVTQPRLAESPLQLFLLAPDEEIHQREVERGDQQRHRRTQEKPGAEENENIAPEVKRIA